MARVRGSGGSGGAGVAPPSAPWALAGDPSCDARRRFASGSIERRTVAIPFSAILRRHGAQKA